MGLCHFEILFRAYDIFCFSINQLVVAKWWLQTVVADYASPFRRLLVVVVVVVVQVAFYFGDTVTLQNSGGG